MPYTLTCHCTAQADVGPLINVVGTMAQVTGYTPVFTYDGSIHWLCPTCTTRCADLLKQLREALGPDVFEWSVVPALRRLGKG